ncbi:MAG: helix-turn-helix domain-containing protein [Deltaproteobacteria bacterium]
MTRAEQGPVRRKALRIELARRNITQQRLALKIHVSPTTLSGWLRGAHPPPKDLAARIEKRLRIPRGRLDPRVVPKPVPRGDKSNG